MKTDKQTVKAALADLGLEIETFLGESMKGRHIPCTLVTAMEYSLMAGGKRLRPALCLTFAELFGLERETAMPFAGALECIHTYSLIHDDLPAMDDDDLRRGKPSSHKKFGEATAILAGDSLLTEAFSLMTWVADAGTVDTGNILAAIRETASAAGGAGMVGGQLIDMDFTGRRHVKLEELRLMHSLKTGALLRCSCLSGALLAGAPKEDLERVRGYGEAVGVAFQIVDDVLDVVGDEATLGKPVGSDAEQGKATYPSLVGIDKSREMAHEQASKAQEFLEPYSGPQADFLRALARYIVERAH